MKPLLRVVIVLPGLFFTLMGVVWLVQPARAAASLGMPLLEGAGRSAQVADMAVFFFALGIMILLSAVRLRSHWFLIPALMLLGAAAFRTFAWLTHGADFVASAVAVELLVGCLLLFARSQLSEQH
ncbi:MAG: hypothetical protein AAGI44_09720 [Pseudomonadota bacterium]